MRLVSWANGICAWVWVLPVIEVNLQTLPLLFAAMCDVARVMFLVESDALTSLIEIFDWF